MKIRTLDNQNESAMVKSFDKSLESDFNVGIGTNGKDVSFTFSCEKNSVFVDISKHDARFLRDRLNEMDLK